MIVHSHLFEHIYDPNAFLKKCHEILNEEGEMFFGVPNMEHIGKNELAPFSGIFFEHTILLNKENITYLLNKNGFNILTIVDYENHSILFHAKKSQTFSTSDNSAVNYELFSSSIENYKKFIEKCLHTIGENPNKKVYIFGASYNTQFLLSMGLNPENITGILDNSVDKQNKYLYGYNLKIHSPEIIRNKDDCVVILKNGYYSNEIMNQLTIAYDCLSNSKNGSIPKEYNQKYLDLTLISIFKILELFNGKYVNNPQLISRRFNGSNLNGEKPSTLDKTAYVIQNVLGSDLKKVIGNLEIYNDMRNDIIHPKRNSRQKKCSPDDLINFMQILKSLIFKTE
jgi:hypothetical protein